MLDLGVNADEIARIAQSRGVVRLRVFGSALTTEFDTASSDIDLLVEFGPGIAVAFDAYFGLKEDLEQLFGRSVDLVVRRPCAIPTSASAP
jgi:uncharacterized protein